jgi:hypothetical protein
MNALKKAETLYKACRLREALRWYRRALRDPSLPDGDRADALYDAG